MPENTSNAISTPAPFLIDRILRSNEVHLISGPSGSGKTTLLLQILDDWRSGREVFSHAVTSADFALVSCDRSVSSIDDTMTRLGMDPATIPHFSIVNPPAALFPRRDAPDFATDGHSLSEILSVCRRITPALRLLFIDGLPALCPGKIMDHKDVANFLRDAGRLCITNQVTILATVYAPKSRDGEGYSSPRDRMLGAGAWASHTSTKFIITPDDTKRTLDILPQNSAPEQVELMHDPANGRLIPYVSSGASEKLDAWLASLDPGMLITTQQAVMVGEMCEVSKSTVEKWLKNQVSMGTLQKIDRGEYRVTGELSKN